MKRTLLWTGFGLTLGWLWNQSKRNRPKPLQHAVTIITGGASGIGKATAHKFARQGAIVIIADLEHQLTAELKQEFTPYDAEILLVACDISQADQRAHLVEEVMKKYKKVDILINNAGISKGGRFAELEPTDIERMISVNLVGTLHLTHSILPFMLDQNKGHIVNVSSVNAVMPPPGEALYSATKAGMNAFSDSLRREYNKHNINISVVMPVLTQTAMLNDVDEEELRDNQLLMPGMSLDTADNVADQILLAVQYNIREIICGDASMGLLAKLSQLRPSAMDWAFRYVIDTDKFIATLQKLGGRNTTLEE